LAEYLFFGYGTFGKKISGKRYDIGATQKRVEDGHPFGGALSHKNALIIPIHTLPK